MIPRAYVRSFWDPYLRSSYGQPILGVLVASAMAVRELRVRLRHPLAAPQPPNLDSCFESFLESLLRPDADAFRPAGTCRCRTWGGVLFASCATRHSSLFDPFA